MGISQHMAAAADGGEFREEVQRGLRAGQDSLPVGLVQQLVQPSLCRGIQSSRAQALHSASGLG